MTRRVLLVTWDALGWAVALSLASVLRDEFDLDNIGAPELFTVVAVAVAAQLAVGAVLQTYRGRYPIGGVDEAINVTAATVLAGAAAFLVDSSLQPHLVPRSVPLLAVPIAVLIAVGSRLAVRLHRERRDRADYSGAQRVIVFGAGTEGRQLLRSMLSDPSGSYLPVALLDDDHVHRRFRMSGVAVRGTRSDIALAAAESQADLLVIADRSLSTESVKEIAEAADDAGLAVTMLPSLDELLRPLPRTSAVPTPRKAADRWVEPGTPSRPARTLRPMPPAALSRSKRALDVVLCLASVLVLLPVLLLISAVLLVSSGQVIYRAPRIGRDGRQFTMFKFATMVPGDSGPRITTQGDMRITPVGRWLRATKLNELPQIFNVLRGDMSLVGPRPEDPRYTVHYSPDQRRVLAVRPGLTSRAFLEFGDEQAFIERARPSDVEAYYLRELLPEKLEIELGYIDNWSMREDLRILAGTVKGLLG
jgi:lipopolysaccharide/colanic/teichoic acid biosynthesis glycosyltransferase